MSEQYYESRSISIQIAKVTSGIWIGVHLQMNSFRRYNTKQLVFMKYVWKIGHLMLFHSWYSDWNTTGNYLYLPKYFMNIMRCGVLCFCTTNDNIRNVIIINSIIYQFYVFEIFLGTIFPCYEWYHRDKTHQWAVFIIYLENSSFTCVKPIYLKIVAL